MGVLAGIVHVPQSSLLTYSIWLNTNVAYCRVQDIVDARICQVLRNFSNVLIK